MKTFSYLALLLVALVAGCKKQEAPPAQPAKTPKVGSNPIQAPNEYLGALAAAKKSAEKTIDTASLNQTINLFNVQEERYPKDMQELVTKGYLPRLPEPPYGMKFQYNPATGQLKVVPKQ